MEHVQNSPIMLDTDDETPTQTEYDKKETSTVPRLPTLKRKHVKAIENVKMLVLRKESGEEVHISSGNCSLSAEHFLDADAAENFLCCMCNNVAFDPRYSFKCKHLYCRTCINNLQEVSGACWLYMMPNTRCSQGTKDGPLRPLPYKENFFYNSLRASCPKCFKVFLYYKDMPKHLACGRGNHSKITKNPESHTTAFEDLHGQLSKLAEVQGVSPSLLGLQFARDFLTSHEVAEEQQLADVSDVFEMEKGSQLSAHDACRYRHRTGTSTNMYNKQKHFLGLFAKENNKPSLNILPHHSKLREEDKKSMPANCSFILFGREGEVVYSHVATHEGPKQLRSLYETLGPGTPIPQMEGSYFSLLCLVAKEIQNHTDQWEEECRKLGVDNDAVLRVIVKIR